MVERIPILKAKMLEELDNDELLEGYSDGRKNEPCGDNRSYSFWHGWRNGMVDAGHMKKDEAQAQLAKDYLRGNQ